MIEVIKTLGVCDSIHSTIFQNEISTKRYRIKKMIKYCNVKAAPTLFSDLPSAPSRAHPPFASDQKRALCEFTHAPSSICRDASKLYFQILQIRIFELCLVNYADSALDLSCPEHLTTTQILMRERRHQKHFERSQS